MIQSLQILRPYDNYEALYINEKKVLEGHSLYVDDIARCILSALGVSPDNLDVVSAEDYDDDSYRDDDKGNSYIDDALIWINGKGCPEDWPFNVEPA